MIFRRFFWRQFGRHEHFPPHEHLPFRLISACSVINHKRRHKHRENKSHNVHRAYEQQTEQRYSVCEKSTDSRLQTKNARCITRTGILKCKRKIRSSVFDQIAGIGVYVTFLNRKVNYGLGEYIKLLRTDNNKEEIT